MLISRLTSKGQATIPIAVRQALHLHSGDRVAFEIKHDQVVLHKVEPLEEGYYKALSGTLSEWNSPADEEDYRDL